MQIMWSFVPNLNPIKITTKVDEINDPQLCG